MSTDPNIPVSTRQTIRDKVRRVTKSPGQNQITDDQVDFYMENYYQFDFPAELRMKDLFSNYVFTTVPNQETYALPTDFWVTVEPPLYINGYQSYFTQSQDAFYRLYPRLGITNQVVVGNGTVGPYTFTLQNYPVLQNNVVITGQSSGGLTSTLVDVPQSQNFPYNPQFGNLLDSNDPSFQNPSIAPVIRGTIDYITGLISINATGFVNPIATGNSLICQIVPYVASRPVAAMFYDDIFYLRPIPDTAYQVSIAAYMTPTAFFDDNTNPKIKQWWQMIALGTSLRIFEDRGDFTQLANFKVLYDQQKLYVLRRTLVEMANERTATIYTDQTDYQHSNFFSQF